MKFSVFFFKLAQSYKARFPRTLAYAFLEQLLSWDKSEEIRMPHNSTKENSQAKLISRKIGRIFQKKTNTP